MTKQSSHHITVGIGTPDRGKIALMWCLSEERAREFVSELTARMGEPDHEFFSTAEHIDKATRELFGPGGPIQIENPGA